MAGAFKTALGSAQGTTSSTTLVITTTAAIAVGDLVIVRVAADNASSTAPTFTATDSGGNTWVTQHQIINGGAAATGVAGGVIATKATNAVALGGTITITLSAAVVAKAAYARSFTGYDNTLTSTPVGNQNGSGTISDTSGTVNAGDLVIAWGAFESNASTPSQDLDTTNGAWNDFSALVDASGGTGSTHVQIVGQFKIPTASGAQTWDSTGPSQDCAGGVVVFSATVSSVALGGLSAGTGSATGTLGLLTLPPGSDITTDYGVFCTNAWGGMNMVKLHDRTGVQPDLNITHATMRATTETGGDVGMGARFDETPGQCSVEVRVVGTDSTIYDPLTGTLHNYPVWSTEVQVWVGIPDGLGPGTPSISLVFVGAVTEYDYVPDPEGVASTLTITAVDDIVGLVDAVTPDRAEEANTDRLNWLAGLSSRVFVAGSILDAYTMGRTAAEAGSNVLEQIIATAHASRGAALIYPSYTSPTAVFMAFYAARLADLGAPTSSPSWLFAKDPATGATGTWDRKVCLASLDVKVNDELIVNQARVRKIINHWVILGYAATTALTLGNVGGNVNKNDLILNNLSTEPGDIFHEHLEIPNYTSSPANGLGIRMYGTWTGMAFFDYKPIQALTDQTSGSTYDVTFPIGYPISLTLHRQIYQTGATGNAVLNGLSTANPIIETFERQAGQGPEYLATNATSIAARSLHELQVASMLAHNADISNFATWLVTRNGVTIPRLYDVAMRVDEVETNFDALVTFTALKLGDRIGVRYQATGTALDHVGWASRLTREITPENWSMRVDVVGYAP